MSTGNSKRRRMSHQYGADRNRRNQSRITICVEPFYECDAEGREVEEVGEGSSVLSVSVPTVVRHHRDRPGAQTLQVGKVSAGSLDLALNVLGHLYPPASDAEEPVRCRVNLVSATAYRMHRDFCAEFLAPMDPGGGEIPVEGIRSWVLGKDRSTES